MRVFSILIALFIAGASQSQIITIFDETNLQPIENVMVFGQDQKSFQLSDSKGKVDISVFNNQEKLYFQHPTYELYEATFSSIFNTQKIYLHENNITIPEVVIAANKWAQNRSEISAKISTITPKQIELDNPQTSADLIGNSGEVYIQKSQQGGGSPMIRGFATNRVLISVDGVRMNTAIFRGGNIQNIISIDPYSVEQSEVLFGPGSVIYGSDAIGGVMSFSTLKPRLATNGKPLVKGSAASRYSSASQEKSIHADVNLGWKKIAILSSFTYNDFGDLKMGSHGPEEYLRPEYVKQINGVDSIVKNEDPQIQVPSGYTQLYAMQKLKFTPNKHWDINYSFIYSETSDYPRYDRYIQYSGDKLKFGRWDYGPQKWSMNALEANYTRVNNYFDEASIRISRQFFEESRWDRRYQKTNLEVKTEHVYAYATNIDFHKNINEKNQLFYGAEWVLNDVDSKAYAEDISTGIRNNIASRYPQSTWSSYALYATYSSKLTNDLRLNTGYRYNYFILDSKFDTTLFPLPFEKAEVKKGALTGSIGIVYTTQSNYNIFANVSSGFRSPNVDDIGKIFDSGDGILVVPNADLEAEYAYNAELAVSKIYADIIRLELTGYVTQLENALVRRPFIYNGSEVFIENNDTSKVVAIQNASKATILGVQASADIKLPYGFALKSRFNWQKGEEEMDDGTMSPSRHAAPWFGATHLIYAIQKFRCDLNANYSGSYAYDDLNAELKDKAYLFAIDSDGNPYAPAWFTLNLKALFQLNEHFSLSAGIENITDLRYKTYSSGLVAPGRNYMLALKAKF